MVFDDELCTCGHSGGEHEEDEPYACTMCMCQWFAPDEEDALS